MAPPVRSVGFAERGGNVPETSFVGGGNERYRYTLKLLVTAGMNHQILLPKNTEYTTQMGDSGV
jgi:hypothetical protein